MEWRSTVKLDDPKAITRVEKELGIQFPEAFRELVLLHNHGSAYPDTFDTETRKGRAFGRLLNFNDDQILKEYRLIKDQLPEQVVPFAGDAGGNYLCFDYRKYQPVIAYWDHESAQVEYVADELGEMLKNLYGEEDTDFEKWRKREVIWENFMNEEKLKELSQDHLNAVNTRRQQKGLPLIVKD